MEPDIPTYNISGTIRDIRKAQEEMESAVARFREHSRPVLTDLSMVPVIYDWFRELSAGNGADGARQSDSLFADMVIEGPMPVERRRKFIFVILYLYAPCRLFSGKMPKGLRRAIVRTLGVRSDTVLSDNANDVLKRYEIYKAWAKDVDGILCAILSRLRGFYDISAIVAKQSPADGGHRDAVT